MATVVGNGSSDPLTSGNVNSNGNGDGNNSRNGNGGFMNDKDFDARTEDLVGKLKLNASKFEEQMKVWKAAIISGR